MVRGTEKKFRNSSDSNWSLTILSNVAVNSLTIPIDPPTVPSALCRYFMIADSRQRLQHVGKVTAVDAIDHQAFLGAMKDRLLLPFGNGMLLRDLVEQMRVLDIHHNVLGVVDLVLQRNPKIAGE